MQSRPERVARHGKGSGSTSSGNWALKCHYPFLPLLVRNVSIPWGWRKGDKEKFFKMRTCAINILGSSRCLVYEWRQRQEFEVWKKCQMTWANRPLSPLVQGSTLHTKWPKFTVKNLLQDYKAAVAGRWTQACGLPISAQTFHCSGER